MPFLRTRRLYLFYRQLATLVSSGVSVIEAMDILSTRMGNNRLKSVVLAVKQYLLEGNSLSDAFAVFPGIFPVWQVNLIKYSETGGRITEGLTRLADHLERDYTLQQNIIVGLAYPVLLLHAAVFLLPLVNIACGIGAYIAGVLKLIIPLYGFIFLQFKNLSIIHSSSLYSPNAAFNLSVKVSNGSRKYNSFPIVFEISSPL